MNEKERQKLRGLIAQAFADAKAKGKSRWQTMDLSVLKNRILQRTDRQFHEADYGAQSMLELVQRFPEFLAVSQGRIPSVSILTDRVDVNTKRGKQGEGHTEGEQQRREGDELGGFQATLDRYRNNGDNLGVGEAYASQLPAVDEEDVEMTFVSMVSRWASSNPVDAEIRSVGDLLDNIDKFVLDLLALAVVHATLRMEEAGRELPKRVGDLNYRIATPLRSLFDVPAKTSPVATMRAATAKTREMQSALGTSVESFCQSPVIAAKLPSTDVIKSAHAYKPYALLGERQTLRDVEVLLGTLFRKFCESCERYEAQRIPRRARDLRRQLMRVLDSLGENLDHRLRRTVLEPVARHMDRLIEEGTQAQR